MHATTTPDEPRQLQLDGALSIYTAADTKPRLSAALQGAIAVEIDLSGIEEFDSAGLQLLLAAREQARRLEIDLHLKGANAVVRELLSLSGLTDLLTDPEAH
jgi:anti-sigma B factor antagonist